MQKRTPPRHARRKSLGTAPRHARAAAPSRTTIIWLSAALVAITVGVFAPVWHFPFVSWDDPGYVSDNAVVSRGLTRAGVAWALTSPGQFYWHPVTWLSHMTDVQIFGMQAGAHHVTNLLLHTAATLLLFLLLRGITGQVWRSALVAALFAVHPMHVESVAWIAERKDVLSGVFWMLTLAAYVQYVRSPGRARYATLVICFALGLMSKPTLVMLPLVLLVLDIWPLGRLGAGTRVVPLLVEKVPLFALSIAASAVTFVTQLQVGAVQSVETVPVSERVSNAVVSSVTYIVMALWPTRLAAFYPFRTIPGWKVVCCSLILAGVSYVVVRARKWRPYLVVGWLWYLVSVLPVIGLVQVGSQSMADRFIYLPLVGLFIAFVLGTADLLASLRAPRVVAGVSAIAIVVASATAARAQVHYWKDSETLWQRAVDVVPNNDLAHANLGLVLAAAGRPDEALVHFSEAVRIIETPDARTGTGRGTPPPEYAALLHNQLGVLLGRQGRSREATQQFREVVRLSPLVADAHRALGQALASDGQLDQALLEWREAIRLEPGRAQFHGDLASVLYRAGDLTGAMVELEEALRLKPTGRDAAKWHYNLAAMLNERGRTGDALRELDSALAINPAYEEARQASIKLRKPPQ